MSEAALLQPVDFRVLEKARSAPAPSSSRQLTYSEAETALGGKVVRQGLGPEVKRSPQYVAASLMRIPATVSSQPGTINNHSRYPQSAAASGQKRS